MHIRTASTLIYSSSGRIPYAAGANPDAASQAFAKWRLVWRLAPRLMERWSAAGSLHDMTSMVLKTTSNGATPSPFTLRCKGVKALSSQSRSRGGGRRFGGLVSTGDWLLTRWARLTASRSACRALRCGRGTLPKRSVPALGRAGLLVRIKLRPQRLFVIAPRPRSGRYAWASILVTRSKITAAKYRWLPHQHRQ